VYGNSPRATNLTTKESVDHVIHNLETGFRLPGAASQFVFLVDFNGFGFRDCTNPSLGIAIVKTFSEYYPERLGQVILLNAPTVFSILYGALQPFLDPRTADKISWVSGDETVRATIDAVLPGDTARWVHEAMAMAPTPGTLPGWTPAEWPPQPDKPLVLAPATSMAATNSEPKPETPMEPSRSEESAAGGGGSPGVPVVASIGAGGEASSAEEAGSSITGPGTGGGSVSGC